jgi:hypothetical protein
LSPSSDSSKKKKYFHALEVRKNKSARYLDKKKRKRVRKGKKRNSRRNARKIKKR